MDESLTQIYELLFINWEQDQPQVQISLPLQMIIKSHFGEQENTELTLNELINIYWLCIRDIIDYLEMEKPTLSMDIIAQEAHKFLKRVLNLDSHHWRQVRQALGDSVDSSGPVI
tara:strand:- start:260 stop:604 length:345 start_codon:yes stop_codon:yes gene_type:complete